MSRPDLIEITTTNMLEVSYLYSLHHQIAEVVIQNGPYGIPELVVTLVGDKIDLDRINFLRGHTRDLTKLDKAFEGILRMVWLKAEGILP